MLEESEEVREQAIARYGDYPLDLVVSTTSEFVMNSKWELCGDVKVKSEILSLYKIKSTGLVYVVGKWTDITDDEGSTKVFLRVAEIKLRKESNCSVVYHAVDLVRVSEEYRGSGIASGLYSALVGMEKIRLLSDSEQYFGARKLWAKLSKKPDLIVDILD